MTNLFNVFACLFALSAALFLWKEPFKLMKDFALLALFLLIFELYAFFTVDALDPNIEILPFRMLAISLCFSTTSLRFKRRRYMMLAQIFWLWIEFFGGLAFFYRGIDVAWTRIVAIMVGAIGSIFLSRINRGMEFCLMVYWIAIWMFF